MPPGLERRRRVERLRTSRRRVLPRQRPDRDDGILALPADIQKDYSTDRTPNYTEIELADETVRTLRTYLAGRWKEAAPLWPSRQSDRMTTESARNVVREAAVGADVWPVIVTGRGDSEDVTAHTLRHSVAYWMVKLGEHNFYYVRSRLRHGTIQTVERVYDHIDRV
ncbi:tyrosine-type recombinase/integrase [Halorubrum distributum]|uniref:tyrosine-type recombinase/integrase n=1 Tax=Halorubrum distributum TaxID=29283 RepID=UPI0029530473|nr:tyrosine-type recombinase/integrase [Halorubrum distributum]MDV7350938.1 tyrosine-type recombinase/integrase [Halorubrum distributum]